MARADRSSPINTFSTSIGLDAGYGGIITILGGLGLVAVGIWLGTLFFSDGYATNVYTELLSVAATTLVLDQLNRRRDRAELKDRLLNELRSSAVGQGTAALDWLRRENWIQQDTLYDKDFYRINWENAYIGDLNFEKATLIEARFVNVTNVITDDDGETEAKPVNFRQANLRFANLQNARLWSVNMEGAALVQANLANAELVSANLERVNAREANLSGIQVMRANFRNAYLRQTDLRGADFRYASLVDVDLREANLAGADLRSATLDNVTWEGRDYAGNRISAILPDGEVWSESTDMGKYINPAHADFGITFEQINRIRSGQGRQAIKLT